MKILSNNLVNGFAVVTGSLMLAGFFVSVGVWKANLENQVNTCKYQIEWFNGKLPDCGAGDCDPPQYGNTEHPHGLVPLHVIPKTAFTEEDTNVVRGSK